MLYELINPSDETHFEAPDLLIATLVTFVLGHGRYAAEPQEEGAEKVPLFLLGGADEWWSERFPDEPMEGAADRHSERVAAALRTVCYGGPRQRLLYDEALAAITNEQRRADFIAKWNDEHRSSLNNIMGRAHSIADSLEAKKEPAQELSRSS